MALVALRHSSASVPVAGSKTYQVSVLKLPALISSSPVVMAASVGPKSLIWPSSIQEEREFENVNLTLASAGNYSPAISSCKSKSGKSK